MSMTTSVNRYQQYQPENRQWHKAWKGKELEAYISSNNNDGVRSYTQET